MKLNFFNFKILNDKVLVTNDFGNYCFLEPNQFIALVNKDIKKDSSLYDKLIGNKMIYDSTNLEFTSDYRYELREAKGHLNNATSLHIFVVTTACNMKCVYCQANNGMNDSNLIMTDTIAEKAVDIALESPSKYLTFEFQGGEPLTNLPVIQHIVEYAEQNKKNHIINYSLVTNLTLLTEEIIDFLVEYHFSVSTSIDGNRIVHNANRKYMNGNDTFDDVVTSLNKLKDKGVEVGAIQTTTRKSLPYATQLVRTYERLGFNNIFIRPLTPLGRAAKNWNLIGYTPEEFIIFYRNAFNEIIKINEEGTVFKENHAAIFLNRIRGKNINYMELRSPCGAGIGQIAYYPDGNIFTCDEARMFYEMGHDTFMIGNVFDHSYKDLISNKVCRTVCAASVLESIPSCCDCVYQPYCGTCPVVNYAIYNDLIEKQPRGYKCKINSGILDTIFNAKITDDSIDHILESWGN